MNILAISILILLPLAAGDDCGRFPWAGFGSPDMPKHTGSYSNSIYGYFVRIPGGLAGYSAAPPAPEHGFGVVLSWEPRAYISFDGSYNAAFAESLREIEETHLKWVREKAERVLSVERRQVRLGPLRARRYIARHTCRNATGRFVEDTTMALHKGVIYSATLLTTEERYAKDRAVLEQMLRSWRLIVRE